MNHSHPFRITSLISAVFSDDRRHRYWLVRIWDRGKPILIVCMFNPSVADDSRDDPTILNLRHFAKLWGYGGILVINLHSYVSSKPDLIRHLGRRAQGDAQPVAWKHALDIADVQGTPILVAWGNLASKADMDQFLAVAQDLRLICLGTTLSGAPKHPLARGKHRIPRDQQPLPWSWAA